MGSKSTFAHVGSSLPCLSQCRYALNRQSSIHSGSSFFSEISRTMSSLIPFGAKSESMSV